MASVNTLATTNAATATATKTATNSGTAGKAETASKSLAGDFNTFLTLLTKQLQYQDPLSPLDTNQFTEQLVSFTGVEQSIQQNKNLEKLIGLFSANGLSSATGYLGKTVAADTDILSVGTDGGSWSYSLGANSAQTELVVTDPRGKIVLKRAGETKAGEHSLDIRPGELPAGSYKLKVTAKNATGASIATDVFLRGEVTSVESANGTTQVVVGQTPVDLNAVSSIAAPPVQQQ